MENKKVIKILQSLKVEPKTKETDTFGYQEEDKHKYEAYNRISLERNNEIDKIINQIIYGK